MARGQESVRAADHDMHPDAVLAPGGILEVDSDQLNIVFGNSGSPQKIVYRDSGLMMRLHLGRDVDRSRRAAMERKSRGKMRTPVS